MVNTAGLPGRERGRRLLPNIIDQKAREEPDKPFWILTNSIDHRSSRTVTYGDFARTIDRMATWLTSTLGKVDQAQRIKQLDANDEPSSSEKWTTVAFISQNPYDFRYLVIIVAGMKTGHNILLPSPRNSTKNNCHLLHNTGCSMIISDMCLEAVVEAAKVDQVLPPDLEELLAQGPYPEYPYLDTWEQAKDKLIFTLHSSGSTGPPKPVPWTHGKLAALDKYAQFPTLNGERRLIEVYDCPGPHFSVMPYFHAAGLTDCFLGSIWFGNEHITLPAGVMPTADNLVRFINVYRPTSLFTPPSVLEDIAEDEKMIQTLSTLGFVHFGGAGIAEHAAKRIYQRVRLQNSIGSTEMACYPAFIPTCKDAVNYYHWSPSLPGLEFREEHGLYEMVVSRNEQFDWAVFHSFPELKEYRTRDLYEKHPTLPHHWKLVARTDDILVLSNGEKVVPLPMEGILRRSSMVSHALVLGHARFTTAALLELDEAATIGWTTSEIIEALKPYIDEANDTSPSHARLSLDRILFTTKEKPMICTPKGNALRQATLVQYESEIEALYSDPGNTDATAAKTPLVRGLEQKETESALAHLIQTITSKALSSSQDFFQAGIDSGNALALTRQINSILQAERHANASKISPSVIYSNPSISSLATAIRGLVQGVVIAPPEIRESKIRNMIRKYGQNMSMAERKRKYAISAQNTVMLTGSTGSLGSYLLHELICDSSVRRIFALNRSEKAASRQFEINSSRGLNTDFSKVSFLQASSEQPFFGFSLCQYRQLADTVTLVIHNAWPVNFNQPLSSFEPHVAGLRNLIDLSATSANSAHVVFVSSIGTTGNWVRLHPGTGAPETLIDDTNVPLEQGYSESKFVSEHVLGMAAGAGIPTNICRVGQIAGPVERRQGEWNKHEWLPSLIKSSSHLKLLPDRLGGETGNVDWIPVDSMARILVEVGMSSLNQSSEVVDSEAKVFNLVNRTAMDWNELVPTVMQYMPAGTAVVPYAYWLAALKESNGEVVDTSENPAVTLMDFWDAMAIGSHPSGLVTDMTLKASLTMRTVQSVNVGWMALWMEQWGYREPRSVALGRHLRAVLAALTGLGTAVLALGSESLTIQKMTWRSMV